MTSDKLVTRWYRPNALLINSNDPDRLKVFFEQFGLSFQKEQHDDGPEHYACQVGQSVLELYPLPTYKVEKAMRALTVEGQPESQVKELYGDAILKRATRWLNCQYKSDHIPWYAKKWTSDDPRFYIDYEHQNCREPCE